MTEIETGAGETPRAVDEIGVRSEPRERLLDAFELSDGNVELLADARIGAGDARCVSGAGGGLRRKRNTAARRERAHQHLPSLSGPFGAADDVIDRKKNVAAPIRAVLEHLHRGQVAMADFHALRFRRHEREGNAEVLFIAKKVVWILELECEAQDGRDRPERDVALVPVEPNANLVATAGRAADDALVDHRRRVGSRLRAGEAEARNLAAVGEPRQPVFPLLF